MIRFDIDLKTLNAIFYIHLSTELIIKITQYTSLMI